MSTENETQPTPPTSPPATPPSPPASTPASPPAAPPSPPAAPPAPEFVPFTKESFKIPEGFQTDDATVEKFLTVMNDQKMEPAARLQHLVDLQSEFMKTESEKATKAWTDMQEQWQTEVKNDKEFGGDKLDATLGAINKMIDKFGSPELRDVLGLTGAGNNVHVVRFLAKLAPFFAEGSPSPAGQTTQTKEPLENRLYPSMNKG